MKRMRKLNTKNKTKKQVNITKYVFVRENSCKLL